MTIPVFIQPSDDMPDGQTLAIVGTLTDSQRGLYSLTQAFTSPAGSPYVKPADMIGALLMRRLLDVSPEGEHFIILVHREGLEYNALDRDIIDSIAEGHEFTRDDVVVHFYADGEFEERPFAMYFSGLI